MNDSQIIPSQSIQDEEMRELVENYRRSEDQLEEVLYFLFTPDDIDSEQLQDCFDYACRYPECESLEGLKD